MTNPTNIALIVLLILTGLFGALSYHFAGAKAEAEQALIQVIDANTALEKSLNLQVESCKIDNKVVAEYQAEKSVQQDKVQAVISKIDSLPKKTSVTSQVKQNEEINIDSALPPDLVRMLSESCLPNDGEACVPSR